MASIELTQDSYDLLRDLVAAEGTTESRLVWDLCLAYGRSKLAASARPGRTWQSVFSRYCSGPVPQPDGPDQALQVAVHLSYQLGLVTDFQGVTVIACAHAPVCERLESAQGYPVETVRAGGFEAWLQAKAEAGVDAERAEHDGDIEVVAETERCCCLEGTPSNMPRCYPSQPDDLVFLVGSELADRYFDVFADRHFGIHTVDTLDGIGGVKALRWYHIGPDEICQCAEDHDNWDECPDVSRDLTFECDRHCSEGCDWVLYPLHGRVWLAVHGTEVDLGPISDDHTAQLVDRLIPDLRL